MLLELIKQRKKSAMKQDPEFEKGSMHTSQGSTKIPIPIDVGISVLLV
jgi:hypothetical protein